MSFSKLELWNAIVSDSWRAQCYSEYLLDCAKNQADLLDAITTCVNDDTLATSIDAAGDTISTAITAVRTKTVETMVAAGVNVDADYIPGSTVYGDYLLEVLNSSYGPSRYLVTTYPEYFSGITAEQFLAVNVDDVVRSNTAIQSIIATKVDEALSAIQLSGESSIPVDGGFAKLKDIVAAAVIGSVFNLSDAMQSLNLLDRAGAMIGSAHMTSDRIIERVKEGFASAVAWGQGFASITKTNISEALSDFDAKVSTMIVDSKERFAQIVNQVRSFVADSVGSVTTMFSIAYKEFGWEQWVADTFTTVDNTDVASYTGASPLDAINLKSARGLLSAVGNTLLGIGYNIFNKVKSWVTTSLWPKVRPLVAALTSNPEDIKLVDASDDSYTCSGFSYASGPDSHFSVRGSFASGAGRANVIQAINDNIGKWVTLETVFGILRFKLGNPELPSDPSDWSGSLDLPVECIFKPKCINVRTAIGYGLLYKYGDIDYYQYTGNHTLYSVYKVNSAAYYDTTLAATKLKAYITDQAMYVDDSASEEEKFLGYSAATLLFSALTSFAAYATFDPSVNGTALTAATGYASQRSGLFSYVSDYVSDSIVTGNPIAFNDLTITVPSNGSLPYPVTNLDFLKAVSGYIPASTRDQSFTRVWSVGNTSPVPSTAFLNNAVPIFSALSAIVKVWLLARSDRVANPTDYLFIPYSTNSYTMPNGRYAIKTDAENQNVANALFTIISVIAVVALVVILGRALKSIYKRAKFIRLTAKRGVLDNAMWNGQKLSLGQKMRYLRYNRKLTAMSNASSGLAGSTSLVSTILGTAATISGTVQEIVSTENDATPASSVRDSDLATEIEAGYERVLQTLK